MQITQRSDCKPAYARATSGCARVGSSRAAVRPLPVVRQRPPNQDAIAVERDIAANPQIVSLRENQRPFPSSS